MIETILLAMLIAKIKGYKPLQLFKAWPIYIIIFFEIVYIISEISIFTGNYTILKYSGVLEKPFLFVLLILALLYRQYISTIIGSVFMILGGILNNIVITVNNGKMPVFPTLSYLTGYVKPEFWKNLNDIHFLGTSTSKMKFLADIFDTGYCVMSIGDILIRVFVFLVIFYTIKQLTILRAS